VADLHRHLPPNLLTCVHDPQLRIRDATEIFIFISGYTAAFVYGRAMLEAGFVVRDRAHPAPGLAIYVAMCFCSRSFLAEILLATVSRTAVHGRNGNHGFSQAADVTIVRRCCSDRP